MRTEKYAKIAKGFYGRGKNVKRVMRNRVEKSLEYAYRDRKVKKRDARKLWTTQLNAGVREHEMRYSEFIHKLQVANVELNRKVLAEVAQAEPYSFRAIVELCKAV